MQVTDTCYRKKRLINPENGQHPIFSGPTLLHFTKDDQTFSRLALEEVHAEPTLINIKSIGENLEEAICKGDYEKLENLTAAIKVSAAEKNRAKSIIMKD